MTAVISRNLLYVLCFQTSVWEIDGVNHRDILSNPAFLRELRAELRHIFTGKTNSDKVGQSLMSRRRFVPNAS